MPIRAFASPTRAGELAHLPNRAISTNTTPYFSLNARAAKTSAPFRRAHRANSNRRSRAAPLEVQAPDRGSSTRFRCKSHRLFRSAPISTNTSPASWQRHRYWHRFVAPFRRHLSHRDITASRRAHRPSVRAFRRRLHRVAKRSRDAIEPILTCLVPNRRRREPAPHRAYRPQISPRSPITPPVPCRARPPPLPLRRVPNAPQTPIRAPPNTAPKARWPRPAPVAPTPTVQKMYI